MLRNYILTGVRNLRKNVGHTSLNILGLSMGILFTFLIGAYVWNELNINKDLRNADRQYFLRSNWKDPNLGVDITTLGPLAKQLKEQYPHLVANYYRWDGITSVVSKDNKFFRENIQLGDSTLLSMFGFKLLHGSARSALNAPFSVVLTNELAHKYFGRSNVVGEPISIQSFGGATREFTITGVLDKMPENSVTNLNAENNNTIFIPTNTYTYFGRMDFELWTNIFVPSYIELQPGIHPKDLEKPIQQLIKSHAPEQIYTNLQVTPESLHGFYLNKDNGLVQRMLYTLSSVGVFILLMAIFNFVNISISSSSARMKEMGVRKVMGGLRSQLVMQFLIESILIVFVSTLVSLILYPFLKPYFEQIVGKAIPQLNEFSILILCIPIFFSVTIGLLAGIYPALVLSSVKSVDSLKGKLRVVADKIILRKSLIGLQFSIAAIVMTGAFVISQQVTHFFSRGLGYNKDFIVSAQVPRDWTPSGVQRMTSIRDQFATVPGVKSVALSYEIPNGMNGGQPPVYKQGTDSTAAIAMQAMVTDNNYLATYGIALAAGKFFSKSETDSSKIVLNEKAARALGWNNPEDALGRLVRIPGNPTVFTISGVTSNFHFGSMQGEIPPILFMQVQLANTYRYLSFKLDPANIPSTIEAIQSKWSSLLPASSFEFSFMDDTLKKLYASELQLKKAAYVATIMAIAIVLLGVLGLVSLSVQKRMKEIALRKVLGASAPEIVSLFLKEFLPVLLIGGVVAIPISWFLMNDWLSNYAYKIELSLIPFLLAITALAILTVLLIGIRIAKATRENPVKNFRAE